MKKKVLLLLMLILSLTATSCTKQEQIVEESSEAIEVEEPEHRHDFVETFKEPTCTEPGYKVLTCECGMVVIDKEHQVAPLGHDVKGSTIIAPTCTETGRKLDVCFRCGEIVADTILPIIPHDYVATVYEASCYHDGCTEYVCSKCGDTYQEDVVPALDHTLVPKRVEPTCITDGYTAMVCSVCGYETDVVSIPKLGHDYVDTVTAPNCGYEGYTTHTCSRCGDTFKDTTTAKVGTHDWVTTKVEPTCGTEGCTLRKCSVCGMEEKTDIVAATGNHSFEEYIEDSTCTEPGYTCQHCYICGYETEHTVIPAGHDYVDEVHDPTDYTDGYTLRICSKCGDYSITPGPKAYTQSMNGEENRAARQSMAESYAYSITDSIINSGMTETEKAFNIYLWLAMNVATQFEQGSDIYKYNFGAEAFSAFYLGISACSGVSEAGMLMLQHAGLECYHINRGEWCHQWIQVKCDGVWYQFDAQNHFYGFIPIE